MSERSGRIVGGICVALILAGCSGSENGGATVGSAQRPSVSEQVSPVDLAPADSWRRWGGPRGDFKVSATGLADVWPAEGPPVLWDRPLGGGYSAIVVDAGSLYTMYRDGKDDVVIALDAIDGATAWEHRYTAPTYESQSVQFGKGPNATPLVLDDRLITLGYTGVLSCIERGTGDLLWSHDLIEDFGGDVLDFGYSASPIEHDGRVVVLIGGLRHGVVAFDPADGSIAWSGPVTSVSYATPIVIDVDGQLQLVYMSADEIVGLDAGSGEKQWSFPVVNQYRNNATGPHFGEGNLLWVATQLDGGTRALHLTRDGGTTKVEELWSTEKL
jgi:outer membrane protein assembly factor BamB